MNTNFGFVRVAAAVPTMRVADCRYNAEQIKLQIDEAISEGVEVICFPELSITGYSCADLFFTQALQQSSMRELESICDYTRGKAIIVLVGAPLQVDNDLFNCAFVMTDGEVMGVVPKVNLRTPVSSTRSGGLPADVLHANIRPEALLRRFRRLRYGVEKCRLERICCSAQGPIPLV